MSNPTQKKVMVAIHLDTFFTWLGEIARLLKNTDQYSPLIYFAQNYGTISRDINFCLEAELPILGYSATNPKALSIDTAPEFNLFEAFKKRIPRFIQPFLRSLFRGNLLFQIFKLAFKLHTTRQLLREHNISLVILGGDIAHYDTAVLIKAAHLNNIPAVVVAGWMVHQDENAEAFMFDPEINCNHWFNHLVSKFYPHWCYEYRGRRLLRLPGAQVVAREWLGLAPPKPWALHSGYADKIAVESEAVYASCVKEGLPAEQLALTGSINQDRMSRMLINTSQQRDILYRELGLPLGRPLILVAHPPNELLRIGGRPECDFSSFTELVDFWIKTVTSVPGWNVVISLHPSLKYEEMKYVENYGARISRSRLSDLVPLCDIFVASVSTTIQWATACGIPVINYDVYRYRQQDYAGIPGMIQTEEQSGFCEALQRLTVDQSFWAEMSQNQRRVASFWGWLDGKAGERLISLLDSLLR